LKDKNQKNHQCFDCLKQKQPFDCYFGYIINNKMARKRAFFFVNLCSILDVGKMAS